MKQWVNVCLAILASSIAASLVAPLLLFAFLIFDHSALRHLAEILLFAWLTAFTTALPCVIFLGLPTYLIMKRFNFLNHSNIAVAGFLLGAIYQVLFSLMTQSGSKHSLDKSSIIFGPIFFGISGIMGSLAGLQTIKKLSSKK